MLAVWLAYGFYPSSFVDMGYLPNSHDSFYHARRILDTIRNPGEFYQYDDRIHVPEGSWLVWPWAYDYLMARVSGLFASAFNIKDPMAVLVRIPVFWIFVNAAIFTWLTVLLRLPAGLKATAIFCFAISPLTQELHGFAVIDHHYIEYTFVLLALALGVAWTGNTHKYAYPVILGGVLGAAPAFHNALFILQLPIIAHYFISWIRGESRIDSRSAYLFSMSLLCATVAFLLPSETFLNGMFNYSLHSWFHLYISACTAVSVIYFSHTTKSKTSVTGYVFLTIVLLWPVINEIVHVTSFVSGGTLKSDELSEYISMPEIFQDSGYMGLAKSYSAMIWVLPITIIWAAGKVLISANESDRYFWIFILFGGALMVFQYRMHYFGSVALVLPFFYEVARKSKKIGISRNVISGIAVALALAAHIPVTGKLFAHRPIGLSLDYELTRDIYKSMSDACRDAPGAVLADYNDGHYIRFHTECSVIANNMILTEQQQSKVAFSDTLLRMSYDDAMKSAPYVSYIYVRRYDNPFDVSASDEKIKQLNKGLRYDLLFSLPPRELQQLMQVNIIVSGRKSVLARLFKVR